MKNSLAALFAATFLLSAFTFIQSTNWQVKDDSYSIKFDTKGATGIMKGLTGTIKFDEADLAQSNFDVSVDVNSINTGNGMKNKHAKAEGFFDAAHYPTIQFTSTKIEKTTTGFLATGRLKMKEVTKEIAIPFTFDKSGNEGAFKGKFEVNRKDFHLDRNGVGETIQVELVVPVKQ